MDTIHVLFLIKKQHFEYWNDRKHRHFSPEDGKGCFSETLSYNYECTRYQNTVCHYHVINSLLRR
jgi:hypothetical protein